MSRNFGTHKDVQAIIRKARKQDWSVELTRSNHILFIAPSGTRIVASLTGSRGADKKVEKFTSQGRFDRLGKYQQK